jgi:hypothetical protein
MSQQCAFCGRPGELLCNHQIGQSADHSSVFRCDLALCRKCVGSEGFCPFHTGKPHNAQTLSPNGATSMRGNLQHLADVARLGQGTNSSIGALWANGGWTSTWNIDTANVANARIRIGFATSANTAPIPTNGIYFCIDTVSGCGSLSTSATTWAACVDTTGTETCFSTGVTFSATYWKFSIASSTAGTIN